MWFHAARKSYYSRVVVPRNLLPLLRGRVEFWKSLRTADRATAKCRATTFEAHGRSMLLHLQRHGATLRQDQINALVASWIHTELETVENARADAARLPHVMREGEPDIWGDLLKQAHEDLTDTACGMAASRRWESWGVPYTHAVALTGHTGGNSDVHFTDYTHMKTLNLAVMKKSMDVLAESYRAMLKGLL